MIQVSQCPSHSFGPTLSSLQITYGFNGVFVFEHSVDEFESKSTVSESLRTVVKNIPMEDLHEVVPLKVDGDCFKHAISVFSLQKGRSGRFPMAGNTTSKLLESSNLTFFAETLSIKFFGDTILEKQPENYMEAVRT